MSNVVRPKLKEVNIDDWAGVEFNVATFTLLERRDG